MVSCGLCAMAKNSFLYAKLDGITYRWAFHLRFAHDDWSVAEVEHWMEQNLRAANTLKIAALRPGLSGNRHGSRHATILCHSDIDAVKIKLRWCDELQHTDFFDYGYPHVMPEAYEKPRNT